MIAKAAVLPVLAVRRLVVVEAGAKAPDLSAFLSIPGTKGMLLTDLSAMDLSKPGDKTVRIQVGTKVRSSTLRLVDTVPPEARAVNRTVAVGQTLKAADFTEDIVDCSNVRVSFSDQPNFNLSGTRRVTVVLEDAYANKTTLKAVLFVVGVKKNVTVQAGAAELPDADAFLDVPAGSDSVSADFESAITVSELSVPGVYDIKINVLGATLASKLTVEDKEPPSAKTAEYEVFQGDSCEASAFLTDITDISEVTVSYVSEPDFSKLGVQTVQVAASDTSGNTSEFESRLTVKPDTEPPRIIGSVDRTVAVGDKVSYRSGITVADNSSSEPVLSVDSSAVNVYQPGKYEVIYTATDLSGNTSTRAGTITVTETDTALVYELADAVLEKITTPDMSLRDKAESIHKWVKSNLRYVSSIEKDDAIKGAYEGLKNRQGDCFIYYSVSELLLTRAGVENMRVTRAGGTSRHFWNLINVGNGWYHFDTCPVRVRVDTFMFTSIQADEYSRTLDYVPLYYVYDKSLYPPVVGDDPEDNVE